MFEKTSYCDLRRKEVINICDGARLGCIYDMELDACTGQILSLVLPGRSRCFGLIKSAEELVVPFCKIKKLGEDVILVEIGP